MLADQPAALQVLLALDRALQPPVHVHVVARKPGRLDVDALARREPARAYGHGHRAPGAWDDDLRRVDGAQAPGRDVDLLSRGHLLPSSAVPSYCRRLARHRRRRRAGRPGPGRQPARGAHGGRGAGVQWVRGPALRREPAQGRRRFRRAPRQGHARHRFDFDAFEVDLLVLDARGVPPPGDGADLRAVRSRSSGSPSGSSCTRGRPPSRRLRRALARGPERGPLSEPSLLHWADQAKPWSDDRVAPEELWLDAAASVASTLPVRAR